MSELALVVRDVERDFQAISSSSFAECVVAALSAEPETLDELGDAVERFVEPGEWINFRSAGPLAELAPGGARFVVVDLAAHLVVADTAFFLSMRRSGDTSEECDADTDDVPPPPLRLSGDWLLSSELLDWHTQADARRRQRLENPPLDARAVLYGEPLVAFIARECWNIFRDRPPLPIVDQDEPEFRDAYNEEYELVRAMHERWMMTPRVDLRGQTPREILLAKSDAINWDLQDRSQQWSYEGHCPRGLDPNSAAFQFAGFGTHELVIYYDMVRHLLWSCRGGVAEFVQEHGEALTVGDFVAEEVAELARERESWLHSPDPEMHGRTPQSVIHNERARLPEGVSGAEMMIDCDCPICQRQAEMPGPAFWHLDGCNMDDDFAFSFHRTLEEWEAEQREYREFNRRFEAKEAEQKRLGVENPERGFCDPDYVWERSFSAPESPGVSAVMRLFGIGAHLSELVVDLKESNKNGERDWAAGPDDLPAENRRLIDGLSRDFGNLRELANSQDHSAAEVLAGPVLDRFCETLNEVAIVHPKLERKCVDLQRKLRQFFDPAHTGVRFDEMSDEEDLPF